MDGILRKSVLALFAHPDDAEIMCAGTLFLLRKAGWSVHIATFTPGDKGTNEYTKREISLIRKAEAKKAAQLLEGDYFCLGFESLRRASCSEQIYTNEWAPRPVVYH